MISVLLADDQNLMIQGIKAILSSEPDLKIVGIANSGKAAIEKAEILKPNILVIDIEMPNLDGITATKLISKKTPATKILVLSSFETTDYIIEALKAGACGYILKSSLAKDLKNAIRTINSGYAQIELLLLPKIISQLKINDSQQRHIDSKRLDFYNERTILSEPKKDNEKLPLENQQAVINRNTSSPVFDFELEKDLKIIIEDEKVKKHSKIRYLVDRVAAKVTKPFRQKKPYLKYILLFLASLLVIILIIGHL